MIVIFATNLQRILQFFFFLSNNNWGTILNCTMNKNQLNLCIKSTFGQCGPTAGPILWWQLSTRQWWGSLRALALGCSLSTTGAPLGWEGRTCKPCWEGETVVIPTLWGNDLIVKCRRHGRGWCSPGKRALPGEEASPWPIDGSFQQFNLPHCFHINCFLSGRQEWSESPT